MLASKTRAPDICTQNQQQIQSNEGVVHVHLCNLCTVDAHRASLSLDVAAQAPWLQNAGTYSASSLLLRRHSPRAAGCPDVGNGWWLPRSVDRIRDESNEGGGMRTCIGDILEYAA
jgi:predicted RNA-binding Zn ribbon-like protein